jgi:polyphosphate glucokinase
VGGGVSKKFSRWSPYVRTRAPLVPAELLNEAGIIGAALLAAG